MKKRTNIYLRADQVAKLKKLAAKAGTSTSTLIRQAIDAYLKKH